MISCEIGTEHELNSILEEIDGIKNSMITYGEDLSSPQEGDVCYDKNGMLGKFVKGLSQNLSIPMVGYAYYKKTRFHYYISKILEIEEITPKDFYLKEIQELSNEGGYRNCSIICTDHSINDSTVSFSLSRGSFATIILREIIKPNDPIRSRFWIKLEIINYKTKTIHFWL